MKIGIISGSGFYEYPELEDIEKIQVNTPFGIANILKGTIKDKIVYYINRHGDKHEILSHQVNYRANIFALKKLEVSYILATSVTGVAQANLDLGKLFIFDDLYFLENRLPNGEICSIFSEIAQKDRGHLIFSTPFSNSLRNAIIESVNKLNYDFYDKGTYAHVNGPRFNSKTEIKALTQLGVSALSQTAGPEIVLAGELEIPYQLIGFGIDYANGVKEEATSVDELNGNIVKSNVVLRNLMVDVIKKLEEVSFDNAFVYRFE